MVIRNLIASLQEEDSVYVNEMGLFRKEFVSSYVQDGQIYPPRYNVSLDPSDDGSGFAFIIFVSKQEQIRIVDADSEIRQWVSQLRESLKKGKSVVFEDFGTFSLLKNGVLSFTCDFIPALNIESEGMDCIPLPPKVEKKPTGTISIEKRDSIVENQEVVPIPEPIVSEPEIPTEPPVIPEPIVSEPEISAEPPVIPEPIVAEPEIPAEPPVIPEPIVSEPEISAEPLVIPEPIVSEPEISEEPLVIPEPIVAEPEILEEPISYINEQVIENEEQTDDNLSSDKGNVTSVKRKSKKRYIGLFILVILLVLGLLGYLFKTELMGLYDHFMNKIRDNMPKTEIVVPAEKVAPEEDFSNDELMDTLLQDDGFSTSEEIISGNETETPAVQQNVSNAQTEPTADDLPEIYFESGKFYVIHGSFTSKKECLQHVRQHYFSKYSPKILRQQGSSRMRVCLKVCETEADANVFAAKFKDAWVLN
ncbi:MAG TPA: hypothetical protein PKK66_07515 [Bacteroidales bacterium]|jgi:hypothetical protein|nr:hypothetical protein [Bacteroidales bacterium]